MTREERLKLKEQTKLQKARQVLTREIQISVKIAENDKNVKLAKIKELIADNSRVKINITLRGREIVHADLALNLLNSITKSLEDTSRVEQEPKLLGRTYSSILRPLSRKERGGV